MDSRFRFSIDRGGTFTDIYCEVVNTDGQVRCLVQKLLSEDPSNYKDAPTEGIRRILEQETNIPHPRFQPVDTSRIDYIRMGTTVATNALLERKGEPMALVTTKGFGDLQYIGNQSRPKIFDLEIRKPELLYEHVVEIDERAILLGEDNTADYSADQIVVGLSGDSIVIEKSIDPQEVRDKLTDIYEQGIRSIAVVLMHSYTFTAHERIIYDIAQEIGFRQISLSSDVMPMVRIVPRGCTTCVDAYLTPIIKRYLESFTKGFDSNIKKVHINFMQSDGGLTPMESFYGNRAILSGPAGGVVGYAVTSKLFSDPNLPVIGFDMGGTSTDVSRYADSFDHVFETTTAGVTIQSPQLDINTVAAGGGSRLFYRNGLFVVGPESAGAHPGPTCYRKHGPLTVTDANVFLGRIQPHLFPAIFGESEKEMLDIQATARAFETLTSVINKDTSSKQYSTDEVAFGFIRVANEAMARPIRNLTTMKGYDVTKHALSCFGGAGPQHCCAITKSLGMKKVYVHRYSGILSAYGLSLADVVVEKQEPFTSASVVSSVGSAMTKLSLLSTDASADLLIQGFEKKDITVQMYLNCRYHGTDTSIMTLLPDDLSNINSDDLGAVIEQIFVSNYEREYGFKLIGREVLVDDVRVRAIGHQSKSLNISTAESTTQGKQETSTSPKEYASVYFEGGRKDTPVYFHSSLALGTKILGPAIIVQDVATVVVEPNCSAIITRFGDIEISIDEAEDKVITTELDPIYMSIFSHRFMGIAEQMGRTLQRTSISVNIKERLDFSCAIFDSQGGLVANAPHLPVHLGAMSEAVRYQMRYWGDNLHDGDVLVSNHPQLAGGSHLPDITVMTPVFINKKIAFFVASRGHHADVGGISPGSMPPLSKTLVEEGAAIVAFKLVENKVFNDSGITELLLAPGKLANNSGARKISDNLSDLRAQVAANNRGCQLMQGLVEEYSLEVVLAYMDHIQVCAESAVRSYLRTFSKQEGLAEVDTVRAIDYLDDGTPIQLAVTIDRGDGSAIFDFSGTGHEIYGNLNAPPAVTASAIIYCMRCLLVNIADIPLNQGCLTPITIRIPSGSILNPSATAAVVGGNVLTSQRVTDVVLLAFKACAASQGCMNNLTFGDHSMGYYETIAGGAGAGPSWHGCSAVHTHMTNTRITDPEILEKRYPIILRQFSVRKGSGGSGRYRGGDGVVRELEFRRPLVVSILSERRALQPYGLLGGSPAARGINLIRFRDGRVISLGGKNTISVSKGDALTIMSPGGGGFGVPSNEDIVDPSQKDGKFTKTVMSSGSLAQYSLNQESV